MWEEQRQAETLCLQLSYLEVTNNIIVTVWNSCVLSLAQIKL